MKKFLPALTVVAIVFALMSLWTDMPNEAGTGDSGYGEADIGGQFSLIDQNGKAVKDEDFRGRLMLVFFGFTQCPDICPVSASTLSRVMEQLNEKEASQVAPIFISVDPDYDTPAVLKDYLSNFDRRMVGLTGTPQQITEAVDGYKVYVYDEAKEKGSDAADGDDYPEGGHRHAAGDYSGDDNGTETEHTHVIDHSGFIYLMSKEGKYITHFPYDATPAEIMDDVRNALK